MPTMPGALVKTVRRFTTPMTPVRLNLHIAVSEASSLHGYFNTAGNPCSHFYVRRDGTTEQYVSTDYRAAADLDGNKDTISVETQGGAAGTWTDQQVAALAGIWAWARTSHGLADRIATDSVPGSTSHGLSWHRLGIDPWRRPAGLRYSSSRGKVCPGDDRIAQVPQIHQASHATHRSGGKKMRVIAGKSTSTVWVTDGQTRRYIAGPSELDDVLAMTGQTGPQIVQQATLEAIPVWKAPGQVDVKTLASQVAATVGSAQNVTAQAIADELARRLAE